LRFFLNKFKLFQFHGIYEMTRNPHISLKIPNNEFLNEKAEVNEYLKIEKDQICILENKHFQYQHFRSEQ